MTINKLDQLPFFEKDFGLGDFYTCIDSPLH